MISLLRDRLVVVWALLVLATVLSFVLAHRHGSLTDAGVVIALAIAFVKVRYVGREFMELDRAPLLLRLVFDLWCAGAGAMVITMFLLGSR
ncbi:cytochrome C oxidase subunit IV family protein [Amycolatopsis acidicola]|uniref:Cytochrome C oxidase subunit IV family protein n=1 Tax=Amycolatopsis acidicola TaxID=2596893 RepID=A0A5N0V213_9PSEU|nr:cytochrome C oxidase subunit IV family protein [Amycolatopsis acidicola]KAA9160467.1 cytochrome C oxidase subunit IV family protein [Amycolatopsis acidicola]